MTDMTPARLPYRLRDLDDVISQMLNAADAAVADQRRFERAMMDAKKVTHEMLRYEITL